MSNIKKRVESRKTNVHLTRCGVERIRGTKHEIHILDELVAMSPYRSKSEYIRAAINAFAGKEVFSDEE